LIKKGLKFKYYCRRFCFLAGVNMPLAILKWLRGEKVEKSLLEPEYGKMFAKNDYLVEVGK